MKRARRLVLSAVALVGVLFLFVLPGRTFLAQRRDLASVRTRIDVLAKENSKLGQQVQVLQTDPEIERLAREQYGMVKPGEQAYAILPPKPPPTTVAPKVPRPPAHPRPGYWDRVAKRLQIWR